MKRLLIAILTVLCFSPALFAGVARADSTVTVGFDDLASGSTVTTQYDASDGLEFQGSANGGQDGVTPTVVANHAAHSAPNAALINCIGCGELAGPADARGFLDEYATAVSVYVGELDNAPDWEPPAGDTAEVELKAYDAGASQIGQTATTTVTVGQPFVQLSVTDPSDQGDIAYFDVTQVYMNASDHPKPIGIDDIGLTRPSTPPPPSFTLDSDGNGVDVTQGLASGTVALTLHRANGSNGGVGLSVSGMPAGMTSSFSEDPVAGTDTTSTLSLTAASTTAAGYYNVTVTATPLSGGAGSADRTVTIPVQVIANCTMFLDTSYIAVQSGTCMTQLSDGTYEVYNQPVEVNGLVLQPLTTTGAGSNLNFDLTNRKITGIGQWKVTIPDGPSDTENFGLWVGTINWSLAPPSQSAQPNWTSGDPITVVDADNSVTNLLVEGLPIGHTKIDFTAAGGADVTPTLTLGFWPFSYLGGLTAAPTIATSNSTGPQWSATEIKLGNVQAFGFGLKNVDLKVVSDDTWQGTATLVLPTPNQFGFTVGIGLKNGGLDYLAGGVTGLNISIADGVFLQSITLSGGGSGIPWTGNVGLSAGPQVAGHAAITINGSVSYTPGNLWVLEAMGNAKLGGHFDLGNADVKYISNGTFMVKGSVDWNAVLAKLTGSISGWVEGSRAFDFEGGLQACVDVWVGSLCGGANGLVSNLGIAACVDLDVISGGIGYYWGGSFSAFSGCNLAPWRPTLSAVTSVPAGRSRKLTLPGGLPSVVFELDSAFGPPPGVRVRGPGGVSITGTTDHPDVRRGNALVLVTKTGATYVVVKNPAAGTWTLTNAGAVPIRQIREAYGLPKPIAHAHVSGRGSARTLSWQLRPLPGQKVEFAEYGTDVRHLITTTAKASGSVRFTPQTGPAGRRRIVAIVEQYGLPRATLTLGSFRAPGPPRPGKVTRLKLTRRGGSLRVTWKAPKQPFRHAVYADLSDGRELLLIVGPKATSATFTGVPATVGATVRVTGLTIAGGKGPTATAKLD
jgi:hypothetical protein